MAIPQSPFSTSAAARSGEHASSSNPFALAVRELTQGIVPTKEITHNSFRRGPAGYDLAKGDGAERTRRIDALAAICPEFTVALVLDGTYSMKGTSETNVREKLTPFLAKTIVENVRYVLNEANAAISTGLQSQLSDAEKTRLMQKGRIGMRTVIVGDSRFNGTGESSEKQTMIDDPPLEVLFGNGIVHLSDDPGKTQETTDGLISHIRKYIPTKVGGRNKGESIPEGIRAIKGISSDIDLKQLGKMITEYMKHGDASKIAPILTYLRGLVNIEDVEYQQHRKPADLLIIVTDEEPPTDKIILSMEDIVKADYEGVEKKTPTIIITSTSMKESWAEYAKRMGATQLTLDALDVASSPVIRASIQQAVLTGTQNNVVRDLKQLSASTK